MTGETRHVAKVYLEKYMWNLDQAIDYFFEPSDPSETQKSLEEAGEGDVTVAKPGMASSQVDVCRPSLPLVLAFYIRCLLFYFHF